ncbi:MAG: hypothetical protein SGBAC_005913 [Bacillariaceae sp.]
MTSIDVTKGRFLGQYLDAAEKGKTGADVQKKASVDGSSKEIVTTGDLDSALDEGRQADDTQQGGNAIEHEDQERQSAEREQQEEQCPSAKSLNTEDSPDSEKKEETGVVLTASEESKEASKKFRTEHTKIGKSDRNILECPTDLYVLIQNKKWNDALKQVKKKAIEASEWTYRKDKKGNIMWRLLPLHASIILNAPEKLVKAILSAYPRGVQCQDDLGMLPIHLVFRAGISPSIAKMLLQAYPQATEVRDFKGRRPLGLAQASASPQREAYLHLLKPTPSTSFTKGDLAAARAEAVAAVTEEKQAAFNKQIEHMKKVYQEEIERLQSEAAKMDELNKSLHVSLARQADKDPKDEEQQKIEGNEPTTRGDPDGAEDAQGDSFSTLAALHTKLAQMEKAHKKEIASIVDAAESKEEQLEKLVNEHFTALEEMKGKMGEMEDEHKQVIHRVIEGQKTKLKETQMEYEGGNSKIIEELRAKIIDMSEAHEDEVNRIKQKFALQLATLEAKIAEERDTYQKKLSDVEAEAEAEAANKDSSDEKSEFTSLCGDLDAVISETEADESGAMKVAELETKLEQLEQAKSELEKKHLEDLISLKAKTASEVSKLQTSLKTLQEETTKQSAMTDEEMTELKAQLNTLVSSKKESTQALSETLDLLENQEMHWTEENEELLQKIEELEAALAAKHELNAKLQALVDEKTKAAFYLKQSSQERESGLLKTTDTLKADIKSMEMDLEVEAAKSKLLQAEVDQLRNKQESMHATLTAEKKTSEIMSVQHKKELAQFESKMNNVEVDLAAERAQTGLLQVQIHQMKDKELFMEQTLEAEKEANEILSNQLKESTTQLENGPSNEMLEELNGELEAVKSKLKEKEEEEQETNLRVQNMLQKEIDLNKHIEGLIEKMMKVQRRSKDIEAKMVRQMETLQAEKNALQGTIMVLSRSLTQQQMDLELIGNESI